jgi:hypothetical protein
VSTAGPSRSAARTVAPVATSITRHDRPASHQACPPWRQARHAPPRRARPRNARRRSALRLDDSSVVAPVVGGKATSAREPSSEPTEHAVPGRGTRDEAPALALGAQRPHPVMSCDAVASIVPSGLNDACATVPGARSAGGARAVPSSAATARVRSTATTVPPSRPTSNATLASSRATRPPHRSRVGHLDARRTPLRRTRARASTRRPRTPRPSQCCRPPPADAPHCSRGRTSAHVRRPPAHEHLAGARRRRRPRVRRPVGPRDHDGRPPSAPTSTRASDPWPRSGFRRPRGPRSGSGRARGRATVVRSAARSWSVNAPSTPPPRGVPARGRSRSRGACERAGLASESMSQTRTGPPSCTTATRRSPGSTASPRRAPWRRRASGARVARRRPHDDDPPRRR